MSLEGKLQSIHDEIQAMKMVQPLNGGALSHHAVTATWEGQIDKNAPISRLSMLAAFEATFERSDGIVKTPLVQFSYLLDPGYEAYGHPDYQGSYAAIVAMNDDSVVYKVVLAQYWWPLDESQTVANVKLTVYAQSPVEGTLSVTRVYS